MKEEEIKIKIKIHKFYNFFLLIQKHHKNQKYLNEKKHYLPKHENKMLKIVNTTFYQFYAISLPVFFLTVA